MNIAHKYQTIGPRFLAAIVDTFVFMPLIVADLVLEEPGYSIGLFLFVSVATALVGHGYNIYLHGRYGKTLGKIVAKVIVVSTDETPIGYYTAFLREALYLPTSLIFILLDVFRVMDGVVVQPGTGTGTGWIDITTYALLIIFAADIIVTLTSDKRRSLHDRIAGTVVVRINV